jgi:hypothetical protein
VAGGAKLCATRDALAALDAGVDLAAASMHAAANARRGDDDD